MKALARLFVLLASFLIAAPGTAARADQSQAHVAVAANFKAAVDVLAPIFEAQAGHKIVVTAGATGKIYAQITNGAPFDVFLAADQKRPALLVSKGHTAGTAFSYAVGRLVLWDPAGGDIGPGRLHQGRDRRLAIANPDLAPYGAGALQILSALGLEEQMRPKLVFGENIAQAFAFARIGAAELGFVALSQILALNPEMRGTWWTPRDNHHAPIIQDGVLLRRARDNEAARAFVIFLQSDEARKVIERLGYALP